MEITPAVEPTPSSVPQISEKLQVSAINKKLTLFAGLTVGLVIVVCVAAISVAIYLLPTSDKFVRAVTSVVPYPVAMVNMSPISFADFYQERSALENFYAANETPEDQKMPESEMDSQIVTTMIDREIFRQLAERYHLTLSQEKLDEIYTSAYASSPSEEEFLSEVNRMFGWDKEEFMTYVIEPFVWASQVEEAVGADGDLQAEAKTKIDAALERVKAGEDFATVAKEVSEDDTASDGGDLGHLSVDQLPEKWIDPVVNGELNTPTDVIDLGTVYSIAMATDRVEGENGTQYNMKVIIVYKTSVDKVVENFTNSAKIWNFLEL
jgi:hypothetical protein